MLHARGQSTAVLQQQLVDRLHRHPIHTTSAGMAHANGPTVRCHFSTCPFIFSQLQRSVCTNGIYSLLRCTMYRVVLLQHVDRLHRHTIHTTSAGMAHANGPTTRCHFSTCPFIFSQLQRSVCTNGIYSLLLQHRYIDFVCVLCTSSSTAAVASLSSPLSLSVFVQGYPFKYRHFSTYPFIFRSYNEVFVQTPFIPYFPSGTYYFSVCDHGPDSLHAVLCDELAFFPLTGDAQKI